jgi:putative Mn2+ efflux pump MntP
MWILEALGLGVGLAMDACAVSMSNGLQESKMKINKMLLIAFAFGFFQLFMPLIGYLAVTLLSNFLGAQFVKIFNYLVPWIALIILAYLGIKMIVEALHDRKNPEVDAKEKKLTLKTLFIQAIATSIDALSVGVIYGEKTFLIAILTFSIVGIVTFLISLSALFIGKKFGLIFKDKAIIVGGIILILIGLEIFFTNWSSVVGGISELIHLIVG